MKSISNQHQIINIIFTLLAILFAFTIGYIYWGYITPHYQDDPVKRCVDAFNQDPAHFPLECYSILETYNRCGPCPQFSPPSPEWCQNGTISPGVLNECGCRTRPTCQINLAPTSPPPENNSTSSASPEITSFPRTTILNDI